MTYEETINLREKLDKDEISPDIAKEMYFTDLKNGKRSWHTNDWKERKKLIIKDKCEQCGSIENITLQHSFHPEKFNKYYFEAYMHFHTIFVEENLSILDNLTSKEDIINYIDNTPRETFSMCPKCGGSYYSRRKEPHLVCGRCKNEFNEPVSKLLPEYIDDLYSTYDISVLDRPANAPGNRKIKHIMLFSEIKRKITNQKIKEMLKVKYQFSIDKKAMIDCLDAGIKYLSFEGTKTLCKKCAFNQDINGKDLCPVCKKNYKAIQYKTCVDCLPDGELKNHIKEQYEFSKKMYEMHKDLGID
jgi:ribosomal protein S27AE